MPPEEEIVERQKTRAESSPSIPDGKTVVVKTAMFVMEPPPRRPVGVTAGPHDTDARLTPAPKTPADMTVGP
jgi:hypothetical protein